MEHSCIVIKGDQTYVSDLTGLKPLISWLRESPEILKGSYVIDKIVGKASALLLVYAGAARVHGETISRTAEKVLQEHGIEYSYDIMTDYIINRMNTGMCPMESKVVDVDSPEEAYAIFSQIF